MKYASANRIIDEPAVNNTRGTPRQPDSTLRRDQFGRIVSRKHRPSEPVHINTEITEFSEVLYGILD